MIVTIGSNYSKQMKYEAFEGQIALVIDSTLKHVTTVKALSGCNIGETFDIHSKDAFLHKATDDKKESNLLFIVDTLKEKTYYHESEDYMMLLFNDATSRFKVAKGFSSIDEFYAFGEKIKEKYNYSDEVLSPDKLTYHHMDDTNDDSSQEMFNELIDVAHQEAIAINDFYGLFSDFFDISLHQKDFEAKLNMSFKKHNYDDMES